MCGLQGLRGWAWRREDLLVASGVRSPDRPVRNESLYRLRYPGPPPPPRVTYCVVLCGTARFFEAFVYTFAVVLSLSVSYLTQLLSTYLRAACYLVHHRLDF